MISRSFLKSSFVFTAGGSLPMVASIILLPFYTNYLTSLQYTQILFYISVSLLLQIFFSFSVEAYFGLQYSKLSGELDKQKRYIGTISILLLLVGGLILSLTAASGDYIFNKIYRSDFLIEFWPYGFYSVLTAFFNSYFKVASVSLIYLQKPQTFFIANLTNFLFTIILSVSGVMLFPNTLIGPMYGRLLSGVVIFIIAHYQFTRHSVFTFDKSFIPAIKKFCGPYLIYVICTWILGQVDRYLLQEHITNKELNAYDLMLKCFFGIEFIQNSLAAIIFPKLYEIWNRIKINQTTIESNRYFNVFTAINIGQLILFCLLIPYVFKLIINKPEFYDAEQYIGVIAAGYALRTVFIFYFSTILFTQKTNVLLRIFGICAALQIILNMLTVRTFGIEGAIYTGLFVKLFQVILCIVFTRHIFQYTFNKMKIIYLPLIYVFVNLMQYIFTKEFFPLFYFVELILYSGLIFIMFKKEIKKVIISFMN